MYPVVSIGSLRGTYVVASATSTVQASYIQLRDSVVTYSNA